MTARVWAALAAVLLAGETLIAAAAAATYMQTARPVPVAAHSHVWANRAAPAAVTHVPWGASGSARVSTAAQTVPAVVLISPPTSPLTHHRWPPIVGPRPRSPAAGGRCAKTPKIPTGSFSEAVCGARGTVARANGSPREKEPARPGPDMLAPSGHRTGLRLPVSRPLTGPTSTPTGPDRQAAQASARARPIRADGGHGLPAVAHGRRAHLTRIPREHRHSHRRGPNPPIVTEVRSG